MKNLFLVLAVCVLASCNKSDQSEKSKEVITKKTASLTSCDEGTIPATFIPVDSANKMISSYLSSINSATNDSSLHSIIFNADSLRAMLNDTQNGTIKRIKIMFAHTLSYINTRGANHPCGYTAGKLTFVISGYDCDGNYVLNPSGKVMNVGMPCPALCPESGTAASDLIGN